MDVRAPACLCLHIMRAHACEREEKRREEMRREEKTQDPQRDAGDPQPQSGDGNEDWRSDGGDNLGA